MLRERHLNRLLSDLKLEYKVTLTFLMAEVVLTFNVIIKSPDDF